MTSAVTKCRINSHRSINMKWTEWIQRKMNHNLPLFWPLPIRYISNVLNYTEGNKEGGRWRLQLWSIRGSMKWNLRWQDGRGRQWELTTTSCVTDTTAQQTFKHKRLRTTCTFVSLFSLCMMLTYLMSSLHLPMCFFFFKHDLFSWLAYFFFECTFQCVSSAVLGHGLHVCNLQQCTIDFSLEHHE